MLKYILKRIGLSIVILLGVSVIIYTLVQLMPGSYVENEIAKLAAGGKEVTDEMRDNMYKAYGQANPNSDTYVWDVIKGYFTWLGNALTGDLGTCLKGAKEPVIKVIADPNRMGVSFMVACIATIFEFMIAIPLGITAATHQYSFRDYLVTILTMVGISLPSFMLGQLLRSVFAMNFDIGEMITNAFNLEWNLQIPYAGALYNDGSLPLILDYGIHFLLPILTVVILSIGPRMRMTRTNMLEVMNSDYIRTARAKGLSEKTVIKKHAFRNTLVPLVTSLAGLLPSLFSGAIITEQVFGLPGIGQYAYQSMLDKDIPFIMGYNMFLAVLSVLGVLLADIMYVIVDPRVKLD